MCNPDFAAKESRFPCGHTEKNVLEYILKLYQQMRYAYLQKKKTVEKASVGYCLQAIRCVVCFFVMSEQ